MAKKMKLTNLCKISDENKKLELLLNKLDSGYNSFDFTTSGSTGKPKTLSFSREQLEISVKQTQEKFKLSANQRFLCPLSLDYVAGKMMLVRAYFLGAELVFVGPSKNPFELEMRSIDFAAFVPLQIDAILKDASSRQKFETIGTVIIGGAPLSYELEYTLRNFANVNVYHTYGMTETLTHVAVRKINGRDSSEYYEALNGVGFKQDKDGCLEIKSPVQSDKWLTTTDVVKLKGSTYFKWLGRKDFIINSGGYKVQTEQVEKKLNELLHKSLLVTSVPDKELGEKVVALVKGEKDTIPKEILAMHLHKYEIPKEWYFISNLPLKSNGKFDRARAKKMAENLSYSS